jgi:hypothetical protein
MNKEMSEQAQAAKMIRQELKKAFPSVKFSVSSRSFAGGDSVDISWVDGPPVNLVESISNKYQYGYFNAMEDIYEYSNSRKDIPQAKYVQTSRDISDTARELFFSWLKKNYLHSDELNSLDEYHEKFQNPYGYATARQFINTRIYEIDLTNGITDAKIEKSMKI